MVWTTMLSHFFHLPTFSLLSNVSSSFIRKHLIFATFRSYLRSLSLNRLNHIKRKGWLILICWPSSSAGKGPGEMILSIFLSSKPPSNHFLQGNMNSRARRPSPSFTIIWLRNQPPPKFTDKKIKICGTTNIPSINISLRKNYKSSIKMSYVLLSTLNNPVNTDLCLQCHVQFSLL